MMRLVLDQPGRQVVEQKRLQQIAHHAQFDGASHRLGIVSRADHDHVALDSGGPHLVDEVEAEHVRQIEVQQDQIGHQPPRGGQCLGARVHDAHGLEVLDPVDERGMDPGDPEVVVDHQDPCHAEVALGRADPLRASLGVIVIHATNAAPWLVCRISTSPPRRRQISLVRARPMPRSPS